MALRFVGDPALSVKGWWNSILTGHGWLQAESGPAVVTGSVTLTAAAVLVGAGMLIIPATATVSSAASLTGSAIVEEHAGASLSSASSLAGGALVEQHAGATLSASSGLSAAAMVQVHGVTTMASAAILAGDSYLIIPSGAALDATTLLVAAGEVFAPAQVVEAAATLEATGVLVAVGEIVVASPPPVGTSSGGPVRFRMSRARKPGPHVVYAGSVLSSRSVLSAVAEIVSGPSVVTPQTVMPLSPVTRLPEWRPALRPLKPSPQRDAEAAPISAPVAALPTKPSTRPRVPVIAPAVSSMDPAPEVSAVGLVVGASVLGSSPSMAGRGVVIVMSGAALVGGVDLSATAWAVVHGAARLAGAGLLEARAEVVPQAPQPAEPDVTLRPPIGQDHHPEDQDEDEILLLLDFL